VMPHRDAPLCPHFGGVKGRGVVWSGGGGGFGVRQHNT